jgi:TonB family protein
MRATSTALGIALACGVAAAQDPPPENSPPDAEPPATQPQAEPPPAPPPPQNLERPKLLVDAQPRYPAKAWDEDIEADVVVLLTLDETGAVTAVELAEPAGHGFDEEALRAARKLRFTPAKVDGVPAPVQIRYTFRFRVPEKKTVAAPPDQRLLDGGAGPPADDRKRGSITVHVFERGVGKRLAGIEVYVLDSDEVHITDGDGVVVIEGPPGAYAFTVRPPGFYPFNRTERIEAGEKLEVNYYIRRHRRDRYSTIVWGSEGRAEVARTALVDDEIRSIPGTFGDPIRVAMLLPGVTSSVSGLGYPIIRGSLPGDSLYEIDGIRVPMLYHLLFGPAVIHPRFVDEIVFQPGGYSAEAGRFPGGRIGATTARVGEDPLWVADLSIIETSLLRSQKLGESSEMIAAARYGTLGYIIEGLAANTVFRYWDYQARLAHRFDHGGKLTLTVLGASDAAGETDEFTGEEEVLRLGFHTADLRYRAAIGSGWIQGGAQIMHEFFEPPSDEDDDLMGGGADLQSVRPYAEVGLVTRAAGDLELKAGGDALIQWFGLRFFDDAPDGVPLVDPDTGVTAGLWAAAEWERGPVIVAPSLRLDHYRYFAGSQTLRETSINPRLSASVKIGDSVTAKAAGGIYSGPPRFSFVEPPIVFGPIPAFEGPGLNRGLARTVQLSAGVEIDLPADFETTVTGFYNDSFAPIDFSLIDVQLEGDGPGCGEVGESESPLDIDGRSFGAELLLRRRLGDRVFGWVSYALSRSEREVRTPSFSETIPFDFDQTHVFNAVVSWEVGRNWTLGGVLHINSGRPFTPIFAASCGGFFEEHRGDYNSDRLPAYWRLDLRIQKREVFDTWFFDFYVDFFNAAFQFETIDFELDGLGQPQPVQVPLFVPTIGVRGEF